MPTRVVSLRQSPAYTPNAASVFGSQRAAKFLQDVVAGRDSLDIVTIGDSNIGSNDYGYTMGIDRVLAYQYGLDMYATPLLPGGNRYIGVSAGGASYILAGNMIGNGNHLFTGYDNDLSSTTGSTAYSGTSGTTQLMGLYTGDSNINALKSYLNFNTTTIDTNFGPSVLQPNRWMCLPTAVATGSSFGGNGSTNVVRLRSWSPLLYGGSTNFQYRLVHGMFGSGTTGSFILRASDGPSGTSYATSSTIYTNGPVGYSTAKLLFTSSSDTFCTWDGGKNPGANVCNGPFAALWNSIIRTNKKGYSVTCLTTSQGQKTTGIADRIENCDKMLDCFLQEIRERQIQAGGSGRVLVFMNTGINESDDASRATDWSAAASRIVTRIESRWVSTGGDRNSLAFVFTVTHPVTSTYGANSGNSGYQWYANRAAVAAAAQTWVAQNAGSNVAYVEIESMYPAVKLLNGSQPTTSTSLYADKTSDQIHLNNSFSANINGYDAVSGCIVSSLLASV